MNNPFLDEENDYPDEKLVQRILRKGDRSALEELILRHQNWIYNIALRMVWNPQDAEDVTQEVLIKIITKLSTFKGKSRFRTWVYRIVVNHVINMKKRDAEKKLVSFTQYEALINGTSDSDAPAQKTLAVELPILIEEIKMECMLGMVICLDRESRLIFILGEIFDVGASIGSVIVEISQDNYRQKLSRARKKVFNFMKKKCGLVNEKNSCHCRRKTRALIEKKVVDPDNLYFTVCSQVKINEVLEEKYSRLKHFYDKQCRLLFKEQPFMNSPDFVKTVRELIQSNEFKDIFDLSH